MSVFDTFFVLFDFDGSNLKHGAQEAKKNTEDLKKSITDTEKASHKLGSSFVDFAKQFAGLATSALSVWGIISGVKAAADYAQSIKQASDATGVSTEALDAWSQAVDRSGGSAYYFEWTVRGVNQTLRDVAKTSEGPAAEAFQKLGLSVKDANGQVKTIIDLLPDIAEQFEKLDKTQSRTLGEQIGLDWGAIQLVQKGRKEVEEMIRRQKELGVVSREDAEIAEKFNNQWKDTSQAFRSLFMTIGSFILPAFTEIGKVVEKVAIFFRKHSAFIEGALLTLAGAITAYVTPALIRMGISAIVAFAPFYAVGAIIAGLAVTFGLLYEDIKLFMEGHDSLTGKILQKWPVIGEIFKTIWEIVKGLANAFIGIADAILHPVETLQNAFKDLIGMYDKVKSFLGFGGGDIKTSIVAGQQALNAASVSPLMAQTSNSIMNANNSNRNTSVQTGPITIQTQATDAEGIASAFGTNLNRQMQQANSNFDDGLMA